MLLFWKTKSCAPKKVKQEKQINFIVCNIILILGNTFKKFCPDQNSWGYGKAFSKAKLMEKQNELLPGGCLTIVCNLEIFYSDRTTQGKKKPRLDFSPPTEISSTLGDQLSDAFSCGSFSDVTLVCGDKRFPCHKFILSARSDVFKAMFSHENTKEGQTNQVSAKIFTI